MIKVEIQHRLGAFQVDARFVSEGHVMALFGHSGSGKISLVKLVPA
jgi:molybdate transport system ATP-binding protein